MTGSTLAAGNLDVRRRKLLFRAWHRGMREMDLILGQYADQYLAGFTDAQLDEFEQILEVLDRDLLKWVTGESPTPEEHDTPLFRDIIDFRDRIQF
ncbi:succinate dehydrogenase assembly factor 2 [Ochrobactrum sp. Sa2BUA5]|jgi:antitoxin CptB|uniref:FAD assembly factor SdhE n=1 Tax=Ochrobactrum quorumnocens TaxID=271865 RepID=A0A5N1JXY1_9HYPH|nr:succinate dehydrogenase assembly factor 2 [[Ochrobactrum] quorumnocens]KAA9368982.1 succinate dehydrogenase assembly factor 2 [[Ochrobactrum] quorumnocens]MBD7990781.1 succinate dehydrogenase assembly factor 2 [Ochrobactrum gallinarum]